MSAFIDTFGAIACLIIIVATVWSNVYIASTNEANFSKRRHWMVQLPSVIATLGVLGTFLGITRGLFAFHPEQLSNSIPTLLEGLKTAFFTSLLGMVGALYLNKVVSKKLSVLEKESVKGPDIASLLMVLQQIAADSRVHLDVSKSLMEVASNSLKGSQATSEKIEEIERTLNSNLGVKLNNIHGSMETLTEKVDTLSNMLRANGETMTQAMGEIRMNTTQMKDDVELISAYLNERGRAQDATSVAQEIESILTSTLGLKLGNIHGSMETLTEKVENLSNMLRANGETMNQAMGEMRMNTTQMKDDVELISAHLNERGAAQDSTSVAEEIGTMAETLKSMRHELARVGMYVQLSALSLSSIDNKASEATDELENRRVIEEVSDLTEESDEFPS